MTRFDPNKPYNDLPLLPPKINLETGNILKKVISSGRALAELKGLGETIPNQSILINSLVLQEAKASSGIENVITTNDALFQAFSTQAANIDPATKEVLRYREALWNGFLSMKKRPLLSTNLFIEIVQMIKKNTAAIRKTPGTRLQNDATGEILYTPPEGESVIRDKLKNLEEYIHTYDSLDPLIKLAVIHYQFEAIHPFPDGNGRTGRIINILYLVMCGLLDLPVLYLSKYIIEHKSDYYKLLRRVTSHGEWEPWILYLLDGVEKMASITRTRILDVRDLMISTMEFCRKHLSRRVFSKELIELLFYQPYTKGKYLVEAGIAKRKTAAEYLKELESIGVLRSQMIGKEKLYLNVKLYDLLSGSRDHVLDA